MLDEASVIFAFALICLSLLLYRHVLKKGIPAPLPPGPRRLPFIGNILDLPRSEPWITYAEWGKQYGDISYVNVLGKSIVVINDVQSAFDMLDRKSRLYSDRPRLVMAGELLGYDQGPVLMSYCDRWSEYRKLYTQFMGTRSKVAEFEDVMQGETNELLKAIVKAPEDWTEHVCKFSGAIVLMLTYGYKTKDSGDAMVKLINETMDQFSETTAPNAYLVDVLPILRYVPEWIPGAGWKKKIPKYRKHLEDTVNIPFEWVNTQIAAGDAKNSFLSKLLTRKERTGEQETIYKWAAVGIYGGGADTTVAGIKTFVLAMTQQVSAQQEAQAEIDRVIGVDRLPTPADRAHLPYFEGLFSEVLRSYVFGPLGIPHVAHEDDIHNGYFIPKGSIIFTNVWQFCRDPRLYLNPETFSPQRFIGDTKEMDPREFMFGFGRRVCPGRHFADASMWLACVSLLAAFSIRPPIKDGKPLIPSGKYIGGSIRHPEPFESVIKPRTSAITTIINAF